MSRPRAVRVVLAVDLTRRYGTADEVIADLAAQTRHAVAADAVVVRVGDAAVRVGSIRLPEAVAKAVYLAGVAVDIHVPGTVRGGALLVADVRRHLRNFAALDDAAAPG